MTTKISRLYDDFNAAETAAHSLEAAGLDSGDISVVASNAEGWYNKNDKIEHVDIEHDKDRDGVDDRAQGARTGAGIGGVAGGAVGLATGLGLLAIPGVGPVVALGWAAATLAGAVTGGVAGGAVGALVESGVSKDDADVYAEAIRRGGALVVARVPDADVGRCKAILDNAAVDVTTRAAAYRQAGWTRFDDTAPPYTADQVVKDRQSYR
ncbi:MAG TPA: hypothetical protein VHZ29_12290 [Rhizomicrobium sp.]|jgi:hypothetical protein|nr:hypothetical protein [Rhizomicrobium sp.]